MWFPHQRLPRVQSSVHSEGCIDGERPRPGACTTAMAVSATGARAGYSVAPAERDRI